MRKISINKKLILILILVGILFGTIGVTAATLINSKEVTYDNTNSKLDSTNLQDAIDELYKNSKLKNKNNIVEAYTYNQTSGASDYCVTGDEDTCVETTCYENTTAGSCPAGTIIVYKVNENKTLRFHVMYDNGATLTMQSQRNTIYNVPWIDKDDYAAENTDGTVCDYESCSDEGPITILNALESATAGWTNVNTITYTMGTTTFKTNEFTGCSDYGTYSTCAVNTYIIPERSAKARMVTVQEAIDLGCTTTFESCPIWMYNYLYNSTSNGGTINDTTTANGASSNSAYWTMNAGSSYVDVAWDVSYRGRANYNYSYVTNYGARAVVEINK